MPSIRAICGIGINTDYVGSGRNWTSPNNISVPGDASEANSNNLNDVTYSNILEAANFDFNAIPDAATIDGIELHSRGYTNHATRDNSDYNSPTDGQWPFLKKGGVFQVNSPSTTGAQTYVNLVPTWLDYGSSSDLWQNTWVPADFKTGLDFGAGIVLIGGQSSTANTRVTQVEITVHYTEGGASHDVDFTASTLQGRTAPFGVEVPPFTLVEFEAQQLQGRTAAFGVTNPESIGFSPGVMQGRTAPFSIVAKLPTEVEFTAKRLKGDFGVFDVTILVHNVEFGTHLLRGRQAQFFLIEGAQPAPVALILQRQGGSIEYSLPLVNFEDLGMGKLRYNDLALDPTDTLVNGQSYTFEARWEDSQGQRSVTPALYNFTHLLLNIDTTEGVITYSGEDATVVAEVQTYVNAGDGSITYLGEAAQVTTQEGLTVDADDGVINYSGEDAIAAQEVQLDIDATDGVVNYIGEDAQVTQTVEAFIDADFAVMTYQSEDATVTQQTDLIIDADFGTVLYQTSDAEVSAGVDQVIQATVGFINYFGADAFDSSALSVRSVILEDEKLEDIIKEQVT